MPVSGHDALRYFQHAGYRFLGIEPEHAVAVEAPIPPPGSYYRLLVAQALVEPMRLITHDPTVARYSDTILHICPGSWLSF